MQNCSLTGDMVLKRTHRWSCRLKVLPQRRHAYLRSELCVNLCFANALELLNSLRQTGHSMPECSPTVTGLNFDGRPFFFGWWDNMWSDVPDEPEWSVIPATAEFELSFKHEPAASNWSSYTAYITAAKFILCLNSNFHCPLQTRKLCYRKDDRAMRPTYGCPTSTATIPNIFMGFCSRRPYECSYKIWSPVTRCWDNRGTPKIWTVPAYAHAPFSENFLMGFYSDRPCKYTRQIWRP